MSKSSDKPAKRRSRGFLPGFVAGLLAYFRVIPTLFKYKLWPIQFIPAFMSLFLSLAVISAAWWAGKFLSMWVDQKVNLPWPEIDDMVTAASGILTLVFLVMAFLFFQKHIILVSLSPMLGKLAEVTYRRIKQDNSTSPLTIPQSLIRGVRINMSNVVKEFFFNIFFFGCNIIPGIGQVLATTGLFLNSSRFMGYGLMDFPLEHKGLTVKESLVFIRQRTGYSAGLGAGYILLMLIPIIGWMFAPTFGTIAGTLVAIDELDREEGEGLLAAN